MLEVRIASVVGEPTGSKLVEKLVAIGVDARGNHNMGTREATARVYWGTCGRESRVPALNKNAASYSKLDELRNFRDNDVPHPKFWTRLPENADDYPILGRQTAHAEGRGINVYNRLRDAIPGRDSYYTQVIPSTNEWRIWVYKNVVLGCYERARTWPVEQEGFGRNWWNGYGYRLSDLPAMVAGEHSKKAIRSCGLDFGAVDLLLGENGRYYVLEVNTAPGANGYCNRALERLAEEIKDWYRGI